MLLPSLQQSFSLYEAGFCACARLRATGAIPEIAPHLDRPGGGYYKLAALTLGRLGYAPARPHLVRLQSDLLYGEDARSVLQELDQIDRANLPAGSEAG
jgi:hypothetical protein